MISLATAVSASNDDHLKRRGGGGGGKSPSLFGSSSSASSISRTGAAPRGFSSHETRNAVAAGAQPAVFKVISSTSSKASAGALLQYLGTRELENGEKIDVAVVTESGVILSSAEERERELEEWSKDFMEPFQNTNFLEASFTLSDPNTDKDTLHAALNKTFAQKPFLYSRSGDQVRVFAYVDTKVAAIAKDIHAKGGAALGEAENKLADKLKSAGIDVAVSIKGAVSRAEKVPYFLQKFIRNNKDITKSDGERQSRSRPDREAKKLFSEWKQDFKVIERRNAYHLLFSARAGTDPAAMLEAVKNTMDARASDHRWMIAHHSETGHVHFHVMMKARSEMGEQARFTKADLYTWRETIAEKAQEQGIAMVATNRMDYAATRPYSLAQAMAYERSNRDEYILRSRDVAVRVEQKRSAAIDVKTVLQHGATLEQMWQRNLQDKTMQRPDALANIRQMQQNIAAITKTNQPTTSTAPAPPTAAVPGSAQTPAVDLDKFLSLVQKRLSETKAMALTSLQYREVMTDIDKDFSRLKELQPSKTDKEKVEEIRLSVRETLRERMSEAQFTENKARTGEGSSSGGGNQGADRGREAVANQAEQGTGNQRTVQNAKDAAKQKATGKQKEEQQKTAQRQVRNTQRDRDDGAER